MQLLKHSYLVTLSVLALAAGGCDSGNFNMVIMFAISPDADCEHPPQEFGPGSDAEFLAGGLMDLGHPKYADPNLAPYYDAWLQVHNYTMFDGDDDVGRINSRDVMLQTVELSYSWIRNDALVAGAGYEALRALESEDISLPISGVVAAASAWDSPGVAVMPISLFPHNIGNSLTLLTDFAGDLDNLPLLVLGVTIRVVGSTLGGTRVESFPIQYPINFCVGCLTGLVCPDGVTPMPFCIPGQDYPKAENCPASN